MKKTLLFTTDLFSNLFSQSKIGRIKRPQSSNQMLVIVVAFLVFSTGLFAQNVDLVITPATSNVNIGDNFSLVVQAQAGSNQADLVGAQLTFNPSVLQVNSLTPASDLPISLDASNGFDNTNGTILHTYGQILPPFPTGNYEVVTINFTAIADGVSNIDFFDPPGVASTIVTFGGNDVTGTTTGATVTVGNVNTPPIADFEATPGTGTQSLQVFFDAGNSDDSDGTIVSYTWDFGDASPSQNGSTLSHTYTAAGTYEVELSIEDDGGLVDVITKSVTVTAVVNTIPTITPIANQSVNENGVLNLNNIIDITDLDNDNLTVSISSASNEPQELQSTNNGAQTDPYPFDASGFLSENVVINTAGSYMADLAFSPTFGDGGSNGDNNAVYTITVTVTDEDLNVITETFDVTVNDVAQVFPAVVNTSVRIQMESYDNQGNIRRWIRRRG